MFVMIFSNVLILLSNISSSMRFSRSFLIYSNFYSIYSSDVEFNNVVIESNKFTYLGGLLTSSIIFVASPTNELTLSKSH